MTHAHAPWLAMAVTVTVVAGCASSHAKPQAKVTPTVPKDSAQAKPPAKTSGPKPYDQVVTAKAKSQRGLFGVHEVEGKYYFEIADSLLGRDLLMATRIAGSAPGISEFMSAGVSVNEQVVRWERLDEKILLRKYSFSSVADDSLPVSRSVIANNFAPILASFPIQAFAKDSGAVVVDVTDFLQGDTPSLSGLSAGVRRAYQVRRLDPARSAITRLKSFPSNIEVRQIQTFDAAEPPADGPTGTISLQVAQSLILLPKVPMRPRYADPRVGYFSVRRINYGLDEQKAAGQEFIERWRLEPKDPAAYARGELVEPIKPIVFYLDPATPTKWRKYVRQGIQDWQKPFETAGFKNAILAKDAPTKAEDPDWDPEDIRYSVIRWAASLTRNAMGPSIADPRTGEIIESEVVWYHNHMRSYRNRLMIETGAANPAARSLEIPESLMGETIRQVIAHEVGHTLGLPHNMTASSSYPVDSLRSRTFARRMGVAPSVMEYARQNYVAQPGDGLEPTDFIRHIGPYDHHSINWGYRVIPDAATAEAERPTLHKWIMAHADDPMYRFADGANDPRTQTEDMGDDPVKATSYAMANLKRVVPKLVEWTTKPGQPYDDLNEIYGELLGQWGTYVRHVVTIIGGRYVTAKASDQKGPVYEVVPRAKQKAALDWLAANVLEAPTWLNEPAILDRVGGTGGFDVLSNRQVGILNSLMDAGRLGRLAEGAVLDPKNAYPLAEYLDDLTHAVWGVPNGRPVDPYRRALQRAYLERAAGLMTQDAPANPFEAASVNLPRSDIRPLMRAELVALQSRASAAARSGDRVTRAHFADVAERIEVVLKGPRGK